MTGSLVEDTRKCQNTQSLDRTWRSREPLRDSGDRQEPVEIVSKIHHIYQEQTENSTYY
jgi:hypothetical protein